MESLLSEFNAFRCEQVRSNEDQKIALEQQIRSNEDLKIAFEEQQSQHKIAIENQKIALEEQQQRSNEKHNIALEQQQSQINALMETIGKLSQNTLFDKSVQY
mmetsp:Transcript_14812/g.34404  ORF Transcript_14812/g.34404 Transcript_14812/m.34404 type:complete len:103 (-) Transcript_14812:122-430(-)